jgi:hypothetical protein
MSQTTSIAIIEGALQSFPGHTSFKPTENPHSTPEWVSVQPRNSAVLFETTSASTCGDWKNAFVRGAASARHAANIHATKISSTHGIQKAAALNLCGDPYYVLIDVDLALKDYSTMYWRSRANCLSAVHCLASAANTSIEPTIEQELSWVSDLYIHSESGNTSKALRVAYNGIEDLLATRNFYSLNKLLQEVNIARLSVEIIVGIVRSTYRARNTLGTWWSLLQRIKDELRARNTPQWERLLIGLPNNK